MAAYTAYGEKDETYRAAVSSMEQLNKDASEIIRGFSVTACTDVTGFGFLGHLREMMGEGVGFTVNTDAIPILPGVYDYAGQFIITEGGQRNRKALADVLDIKTGDETMTEILFDPQTSGGLLFTLPESESEGCVKALKEKNITASIVAKVITGENKIILV
jgi:selenide,water dikinase